MTTSSVCQAARDTGTIRDTPSLVPFFFLVHHLHSNLRNAPPPLTPALD